MAQRPNHTGHDLKKIYEEGYGSWVVECTCGWREKAENETTARQRIGKHMNQPHRT